MPKKVIKKKVDSESELMSLAKGQRVPEHLLDLFVLKQVTDGNEDDFCMNRIVFGPQAKVCHCSRKKDGHKVHVALYNHTGYLVCNPWK